MKRYNDYKELLKDNGVEFSSHIVYAEEKLRDFLNCNGSEIVINENKEPRYIFKLEFDDKILEIGVTSVMDQEENFKYYYWLEV